MATDVSSQGHAEISKFRTRIEELTPKSYSPQLLEGYFGDATTIADIYREISGHDYENTEDVLDEVYNRLEANIRAHDLGQDPENLRRVIDDLEDGAKLTSRDVRILLNSAQK